MQDTTAPVSNCRDMKRNLSRREFLKAGAITAAGFSATKLIASDSTVLPQSGSKIIAVSSGNGLRATEIAARMMKEGKDVVDAAVEGVVPVEEDPNDMSVGYGGLPNERGVVELDSCVMHGPTMRAGAVGALQNIKTPSRVANMVMRRTDHVFLVGGGALEFAKAMGFEEHNLLTERAREQWMRWKSRLTKEDDWLDSDETEKDFGKAEMVPGLPKRPTGTITCLCLNDKGELGGCTSTSGLAFKIPGRVGDSPIIGAGLYVDGEVGAVGSTGRGEANIQACGSRTIVENMKDGMEPRAAIMDVLKRVCDQTRSERLLVSKGKPNFNLTYYAVRKDGKFAAASIYKGGNFAVFDGSENKLVDLDFLHEKA